MICGAVATRGLWGLLFFGLVLTGAQAKNLHRLVVPFPAGGSLDAAARLLAADLGQRTGQPFIVENRPGADGMVAARYVLRYQGPDRVLMMVNPAQGSAELQGLFESDFLKAFEPVVHLADTEVLLVGRTDWEVTSLDQLVTLSKRGQLRASCAGVPGQFSRACEWLGRRLGGAVVTAPYKGEAAALQDVLAGHVDFMFVTRSSAFEWLARGRIRLLASAGTMSASAPFDQAPLLAKSFPDLKLTSFMGLVVPAHTKPVWAAQINQHINQALKTDGFRQFMSQSQLVPRGGAPHALRDVYLANLQQQRHILQGVKP